MTAAMWKLVVIFGTVMVEKGIPAALGLIRDWGVDDPTEEEIDALHARVRRPEDYLGPKEAT